MQDAIVWLIIAAFYAPLHYLLPVLVLFITGNESADVRKRLVRSALIDATLSMAVAFAVAIYLAGRQQISTAMLVLLLAMGFPFVRLWRHRREMVETNT